MKVKDLIQKLHAFDENATVKINGNTNIYDIRSFQYNSFERKDLISRSHELYNNTNYIDIRFIEDDGYTITEQDIDKSIHISEELESNGTLTYLSNALYDMLYLENTKQNRRHIETAANIILNAKSYDYKVKVLQSSDSEKTLTILFY